MTKLMKNLEGGDMGEGHVHQFDEELPGEGYAILVGDPDVIRIPSDFGGGYGRLVERFALSSCPLCSAHNRTQAIKTDRLGPNGRPLCVAGCTGTGQYAWFEAPTD